jgi:hypothetical protein
MTQINSISEARSQLQLGKRLQAKHEYSKETSFQTHLNACLASPDYNTSQEVVARIQADIAASQERQAALVAKYTEGVASGDENAIVLPQEELDAVEAQLPAIAKDIRQRLVDEIVVTVDGMDFQGDELSQGRISRTLAALAPGETTEWKLADNTKAVVTRDQMAQALRLAGAKQTEIWFIA